MCFLCLTWTYFRLPEPKGRTYGELDVLFERRVPARKFKTTSVDQFRGETVRIDSVSEGVKSSKGTEVEEKEFVDNEF